MEEEADNGEMEDESESERTEAPAKEKKEKKKKMERIGGEKGGVECQGTVAVLSPVTHTDVWGGEEEQEEDWGESRGAEKVRETTSEEEMKKR